MIQSPIGDIGTTRKHPPACGTLYLLVKGQGYIWMAHRDPSSPGWALARHSKALWEQIVSDQQQQHTSSALQEALEWQANGSLLLATTDAEVLQLQQRAQMLQQQGVPGVVLLSPREMLMLEPALKMPPGSRGLLVKSDAQIVSGTNQGYSCACEPDPPGQHVWLWCVARHTHSLNAILWVLVYKTSHQQPGYRHVPAKQVTLAPQEASDSTAVCLCWMSALQACC